MPTTYLLRSRAQVTASKSTEGTQCVGTLQKRNANVCAAAMQIALSKRARLSHSKGRDDHEESKILPRDMKSSFGLAQNGPETSYSRLRKILGKDFDMSEQEGKRVSVFKENLTEHEKAEILKQFKGMECFFYDFRLRAESLARYTSRHIGLGTVPPYHLSYSAGQQVQPVDLSSGTPLIYVDRLQNAKMYCITCYHGLVATCNCFHSRVQVQEGTLPPLLIVIATNNNECSEQSKPALQYYGFSSNPRAMEMMNCKPDRALFQATPMCGLMTNSLCQGGSAWIMDFLLARMSLPDSTNDSEIRMNNKNITEMGMRGVSAIITSSLGRCAGRMLVRGIYEVTDYDIAKGDLRHKRLFHGGANMAEGHLIEDEISFAWNIPFYPCYAMAKHSFGAKFDVPLLPGQSGSMIYVESEERNKLDIFGILIARLTGQDNVSRNHFSIAVIQPLYPMLQYLRNRTDNFKDGNFYTPYEFSLRFPRKSVSWDTPTT